MIHRDGGGGFGLVEFLVALLVLSLGILHVLHSQLSGNRLLQEGTQRASATALARDLVTRIQLNPRSTSRYRIERPEDLGAAIEPPAVNCAEVPCTETQMAEYELWQWRRLLLGQPLGTPAGGSDATATAGPPAFAFPAVCVDYTGRVATVTVGWFSRELPSSEQRYECREGDVVGVQGSEFSAVLFTIQLHAWVGGAVDA